MNKDYKDSVDFIRKSERDDYSHGVKRVYNIHIDSDNVWAKFRPDFTYKIKLDINNFSRIVLDFENSKVSLIPSKKKDEDEIVTYSNLYINNIGGEVKLDYNSTGEGKIDTFDYLDVNVKCDSLVIANCNHENNFNIFNGMIAKEMKFDHCNLNCNISSNCIDDIEVLMLEDSSINCKLDSFIKLHELALNDSSLVLDSKREINLYSSYITLENSLLGVITNSISRIAFKYLNMIDSKINSDNNGICIHGVKDANLQNSIIGNINFNNDITISNVDRDNLSVIYNNVSDKDSLSYTGFVERYRGELRSLYIAGNLTEYEYNCIINDLEDFLVNDK